MAEESSGEIKQNSFYPQLPPISGNSNEYRLNEISEIKKIFEKEIKIRKNIYLKYKKTSTIIAWSNHILNALSVSASAVGISAIAGVITAPAGFVLSATGIGSAMISSALSQTNKKKIIKKQIKHEKIYTLAVTKLNTISDLVSKALSDGHITHEEFKLILNEREKYIILKNNISRQSREQITNTNIDVEEIKKSFLEKGKKIAQR